MAPENQLDPSTVCARGIDSPRSLTEPLAPALQLSSVYRIADLDQIDALYRAEEFGYVYSRDGHPNATELAAKVAALEGAEEALVCASGMGAEASVLLAELNQGDDVALSDGLYGKTFALVGKELFRFGVGHRLFDATDRDSLRAALTDRTKVVFVETLSNPLLRLADVEALAEIAHEAGALLVVDHTMAPLLCRPLAMGADAVTHSLTKLIGGHSDLLLGLVAGSREVIGRAAAVASTFGLNGNPFESWLALRGVSTLKLRSDRACASALFLAERLEAHDRVVTVLYPGLPSHPDHDRASRVLRGGFGAMLTIDLGGKSQVQAFIRSLRHIPFAPSFGDVMTTLSHPATTSHRGLSPEHQARQGITPGLVRVSVGLEDPEDVWNDIEQALRKV